VVEEDATQRPYIVNEVKLKTVSHFSGDKTNHGKRSYQRNRKKMFQKKRGEEDEKCTPSKDIFVYVNRCSFRE
jgi:hypothetical protein